MSTYTDLRNRVKENITVGYDAADRTTIQKVKFHNEENEYWGTFTGRMSVDNVTINSGTLNEVSIYNSYIKNATLVNADGIKINLSELGEGIDEISNWALPQIRSDIQYVSAAVSALGDVPGEIEGLKQDISYVSAAHDEAISEEISARIKADCDISTLLSGDLDSKISTERRERLSVDDQLDTAIKAESDARKAADIGISAGLREYAEECRHYSVKSIDTDVKMPFKAKEFAVNIINNYDLPDAFAKDSQTGDCVAKIERYVLSNRNCEFVPFSDAPTKYLTILGNSTYTYKSGESTSKPCVDPTYQLTYYHDSVSSQVSCQHFTLAPVDSSIRYVYYNNEAVGVVTGAPTDPVVSGAVRITAGSNSPLSVFADGIAHLFSTTSPEIEFSGGNDRLTFDYSMSAFKCDIGLKTYLYEGLSSGTPGSEWGKIFKESIEGDVSAPSAFAVTFEPTQSGIYAQTSYRLCQDNGFKATVSSVPETDYLDVVKYASNSVSYYRELIKYAYSCRITTATSVCTGEIVIGRYNRKIEDDFEQVSAVLSGAFPDWDIWANPILLTANASGGYSYRGTILSNEVSADLIGKSKLTIKVKSGDVTSDMTGTLTGDAYVKTDDSLAPYVQSQQIQFPVACTSTVQIPTLTCYAHIAGTASDTRLTCRFDLTDRHDYAENQYSVNDIVIQIPDKPAGSSIAREFLFVVKPTLKEGVKANIRFVGEDGRDIVWFSDKQTKLEILTGTFITFKLQEVRDGVFLVVDWNLNKQQQEIDDLYRRVSEEISARISSDLSIQAEMHELVSEEISARISSDLSIQTELEDLSVQVWDKFEDVDRQISSLSDEVSSLILRDRKDISLLGELSANGHIELSPFLGSQDVFQPIGGLNAKVKQNWMYRMNGKLNSPLIDNSGVSDYIGDNDYVIFKNEKLVKDILFSDINFIRDSKAETEHVAEELSTWTNANFMHLAGGNSVSGYNKFVGKLKAYQFEAPSADIGDASMENAYVESLTAQSVSAATLSVESTKLVFSDYDRSAASVIDELVVSANYSVSGVNENKKNVGILSSRYDQTFLPNDHTKCADLSADNLRLFDVKAYDDEEKHREYRMILSSGTIVLERIKIV